MSSIAEILTFIENIVALWSNQISLMKQETESLQVTGDVDWGLKYFSAVEIKPTAGRERKRSHWDCNWIWTRWRWMWQVRWLSFLFGDPDGTTIRKGNKNELDDISTKTRSVGVRVASSIQLYCTTR
jgi:hypothetical protein